MTDSKPLEPLVSVIMTAFNRELYIAEAIESVLNSEYKNFELLIFDDSSSDATVDIVKKYLGDSRLQLHINPVNLGDYPNRNFAASHARGKYMMFCDSDDQIFDDTLGYCITAMENSGNAKLAMYYAGVADKPFILSSLEAIRKHFFETPVLTMGPGGTIIDRTFFNSIGGYPEKYGPANDMYFNLKASSETSILFLPKLFLHYRQHDGQQKNNLYAYKHYNYRYQADALQEIDMGLNEKEISYLKKKNDRRFVTNLFNELIKRKSIYPVKDLWTKAGFNIQHLVSGILH